jgi:hypothetical protein
VFSTFTQSAGRVRLSPVGSGRPVSGATGTTGAGTVVVVDGATVVVVVSSVVAIVLGVVVVAP